MATIQLYNHTSKILVDGTCAPSDTYRMMLLNEAGFDATHTTLAEVKATGTEVFGNGWDEGGESLGTVTITTVSTNDAKFDAPDVIVAISGGTLGPYTHFVIFDDTVTSPIDPCLALVTLNAPETIADGGAAGAIWNTNGIFRWLVT
jgi:hypothetical protein